MILANIKCLLILVTFQRLQCARLQCAMGMKRAHYVHPVGFQSIHIILSNFDRIKYCFFFSLKIQQFQPGTEDATLSSLRKTGNLSTGWKTEKPFSVASLAVSTPFHQVLSKWLVLNSLQELLRWMLMASSLFLVTFPDAAKISPGFLAALPCLKGRNEMPFYTVYRSKLLTENNCQDFPHF